MRSVFSLLFIVLFLFNTTFGQKNNSQKGLEIIEDYLTSIGGRALLEQIEDETMILNTLPGSVKINLKIIKKYPNKYYQILNMDSFTQEVIFNGKEGKTIQFGQEMFFDEIENLRMQEQNQMHLLFNPDSFGIKVELIGEEVIDESDCYIVMLSLHNDVQWKMYFDQDNKHLVRQIIPIFTETGKYNQIIDFYDYKNFQGYVYASRIRQLMGPQTVEMIVESVKINSGVDDSLFRVE